MKTILALVVLLLAAAMAYVRLAPTDPDAWHVDPLKAPDPGEGGVLLHPDDSKFYPLPPASLLAAFDQVAREEPRTTRLAGSVEDGRITYVARSLVWGFPDYITVAAVPEGEGARLAVYSRLRFGRGDMGVNRKRLDRWLHRLDAVVE
ncbi:DUF1499 domain-containing protein [Psychromarinibacter sp. S121]|uniref:DUF1499 domain-containing protein n=1 Tax=Psychromarinibacter sp. S121 TaxID=3415127 RepID=UPI003C79C7AA